MREETTYSVLLQSSARVLIFGFFFSIIIIPVEFPVFKDGENSEGKQAYARPLYSANPNKRKEFSKPWLSSLNLSAAISDTTSETHLMKSTREAIVLGRQLLEEIELIHGEASKRSHAKSDSKPCRHSISVARDEFMKNEKLLVLPCGLTFGSNITIIATPNGTQFVIELRGIKTVEEEHPPRILHFNPRLKGDRSGKPVIETNTCYRLQCPTPQRCEGLRSQEDEETVDGMVKCEKWISDEDYNPEKSNVTRKAANASVDRPFPFAQGKVFSLTLTAGLEGYHVNVDGEHLASFPYPIGFSLGDATGLSVRGDVDVQSVHCASLPSSYPTFSPMSHLEFSERWKAPPLNDTPVELFIGIISAGSHFNERMGLRKSWMQHHLIKSSTVTARFFVALNGRKEINVEILKEAEFFQDIVIVPYMDFYHLIVLKTIAIYDYGVTRIPSKYIMKCDDDSLIRVGGIIQELRKFENKSSLYMGNILYNIMPMRSGKWAITYEEWPDKPFPPYACGPGYILSSDIAKYIVSEFSRHKLPLSTMEDVETGVWVWSYNTTVPVKYIHNPSKFCILRCAEGCIASRYQTPRQMICIWAKLTRLESPGCCNI